MSEDTTVQPTEPAANAPAPSVVDPITTADVDTFAGDVKGGLEINGQVPEEQEDETTTDTTDEGKQEVNGDGTGEAAADEGSGEGTEGVEEDEEAEPAPELKTEVDDTPVAPTLEDPGEFKAEDHSFQIVLGDGKTYTVKGSDDVDAIADLIEEKPEIISAKQFIEFNRQVAKLESAVDQERKDWEKKSEAFKEQTEQNATQVQQLQAWQQELDYLQSKGSLPAIAQEFVNADWQDSKVAKDPGIAARLEIMQWMQQENSRRSKAGINPVTSFVDAFSTMQFEKLTTENKKTDKKDKQVRRAKGAMVGSAAPYQPSNVGKGEIVGEGGSLSDLW